MGFTIDHAVKMMVTIFMIALLLIAASLFMGGNSSNVKSNADKSMDTSEGIKNETNETKYQEYASTKLHADSSFQNVTMKLNQGQTTTQSVNSSTSKHPKWMVRMNGEDKFKSFANATGLTLKETTASGSYKATLSVTGSFDVNQAVVRYVADDSVIEYRIVVNGY